jgi:hypothetical protein
VRKRANFRDGINELFLEVPARLHQCTPGDTFGGGGGVQNISYIDWADGEWRWFKNSGIMLLFI